MASSFRFRPVCFRRGRPFVLLAALLFVAAGPARAVSADPITVAVTSGGAFLSISGGEELSFGFFLPGIGEVSGYTSDIQGLHAEAFPAPPALVAGVPYTLTSAATFSSGQIMEAGVLGPVIPAWRVTGAFTFEGGTGPLVPHAEDWGTQYVATAPFVFSGLLNQYDWSTGALLNTFVLSGRGTGRAFFSQYPGSGTPILGHLAYNFEAAQPVPEPATWFLLACGLGALRKWRHSPFLPLI